ncbi:MAG: hypothetical protein Q8911_13715 [Bacillota bacterium]|nr:hypothetical protein [Bacillota bacterium]
MKCTCDHEVEPYCNCPNCGGPEMDNKHSASVDEEVTKQVHNDENGEFEGCAAGVQISFWP